MYKDDYISALGKLAPSEAWRADTLAKMRAAQAARETGAAAQEAQAADAPALRAAAGGRARKRGWYLAGCAAAAVLAVALAAQPERLFENTAGGTAQYGLAAAPQEEAAAQDAAPSAAAAAPQDGGSREAGARAAAGNTWDTAGPAERSKLAFAMDAGGGGDIVARADADIAGANPTRDLAEARLPAALPVYAVPDSSEEMEAVLSEAAAALGETLTAFEAQGGPPDAAGEDAPYAVGSAGRYRLSYENGAVQVTDAGGQALAEKPAGLSGEALYAYYYENFAAQLCPLEAPALELTGGYGMDKKKQETPVWFEAGGGDAAQQLYSYSFCRVQLGVREDGALERVWYMAAPQALRTCSLRTLAQAKQALLAGEGLRSGAGEPGGYSGTDVELLHWEIVYAADGGTGVLQPVYRFTVRSFDEDAALQFEDGDPAGFFAVTSVYVPAVADGCLDGAAGAEAAD